MSTGSSNLESLKSSSIFSLLSTFLAISLSSVCGTTLCLDAHTKNFLCIIDAHPHIPMQTEAQTVNAFNLLDSTISAEGNTSLLIRFQTLGTDRTPAQSPPLPKTQNFPCSPKDKPKPCPEVVHVLICPPAGHVNRSLSHQE